MTTITAPALVIQGVDDLFFVPARVARTRLLPFRVLRFMLIDGMGHDLPHQLYKSV